METPAQIQSLTNITIAVLFGLIVIGFIINLVYIKNLRKLLNYIKEKHPDKWKQMGEPSIFYNNSPKNVFQVLKFFRKPIETEDEQLKLLKQKTKFLLIASLALFALGASSIIVIPIITLLII